MPTIKTVREMYTRMKIERRIAANRIVGTMGFRAHFSSTPDRHSWDLCGRPVYWWTMKTAMETKYIEKIVVWTDDKKAQEVARKMSDKFVIYDRALEECKEPMWRFVDDLKTNKSRVNTQRPWRERGKEIRELLGFEPTLFVYFIANQPLIRAGSVTKLIEKYFEDDIAEWAALVTRTRQGAIYIKHPEYPEYLIPIFNTNIGATRQERLGTYALLGPSIQPYLTLHSMARRIVYVEIGEDERVDVHSKDDLELAEYKMRKRLEREGSGGK